MRAAVIQYHVKPGAVQENQKKAEHFLREAKAQGAEIALLPELWNCGFQLEDLLDLAENLKNGPSVRLLQQLAAELELFIFGGSIAEAKEDKYYNTALAINEKGVLVEKYRKTHLFQLGLQEHNHFTPGHKWNFVDLPQIKVGMAICYDLRFPEFVRNLALRGARLLTFPAQWPEVRIKDMDVLMRARAIENQAFLMSANAVGDINGMYHSGHSLIVSPFGDVLADAGETEGIAVADLDLELIEKSSRIDVFGERLRIIDEIDDNLL